MVTERFPQRSGALRPRLPKVRRLWRIGRLPIWLACAAAVACASSPPPLPVAGGSVRGRMLAATEGDASAGEPIFVFLEPLEAASSHPSQLQPALLRLGERGLAPAVLGVAAGTSVRLANETGIYHRLFSYSESNPFDLGVLRRGETRAIDLRAPGVVRIYCSLHPSERAVVFIAPSPYFTTFQPPAGYEIRDVPPGRYRLHARSESAPAPTRTVTVRSGASVTAAIESPPAVVE